MHNSRRKQYKNTFNKLENVFSVSTDPCMSWKLSPRSIESSFIVTTHTACLRSSSPRHQLQSHTKGHSESIKRHYKFNFASFCITTFKTRSLHARHNKYVETTEHELVSCKPLFLTFCACCTGTVAIPNRLCGKPEPLYTSTLSGRHCAQHLFSQFTDGTIFPAFGLISRARCGVNGSRECLHRNVEDFGCEGCLPGSVRSV